MSITIRPITAADRPAWAPLWQGYLEFYKVPDLAAEITDKTFARLLDDAEPVHGFVAEDEAGALLGFVHYIFHRNTWMIADVCYLEDLFTAPQARGKGVGTALIEAVYGAAQRRGAPRVYWLTHETNKTAQSLYDKVAERSGFIQFRRNFA
ncbi:GNAT family N-acetyltransferase [Acidocella sp.]|uniref:GNAT family N-acetyltransferase n=1 Tax=Acidocella sp. TaxID=50710 RepID=UPI002633C37B|nr:GNAT family N-acetyltransferase [Acidocella sp.]